MVDSISPATVTVVKLKPRRKRRWLRVLGVLLLLLAVFVVFLPTFVTWGLGKGLITGAIENSINGSVAIDRIGLSWLGGQSVTGLAVTDPAGKKVADLDLSIDAGLLKLLTGRVDALNVNVAGTLAGEVRKDGSISFADLFRDEPKNDGKPAPPDGQKPPPDQSEPDAPFTLPEIPALNVNVNGLTLNLVNLKSSQTLVLEDLTGKLAYVQPDQPITIDLHGKTITNDVPGAVDLTGQADGLFDSQRQLSLGGASARLDLSVKSIPLPLLPVETQLQSLALKLASDDLTGKIIIELRGDAQMKGQPQPSRIQSDIALNKVLDSAGDLSFAGASASVNLQAQSIPLMVEDIDGEIQTANLVIASEDLTKELKLTLDGASRLEGEAPSPLSGALTVARPFKPDGSPDFALDRITGNLSGKTIPTALAQPFLQGTPIVASRDIGEVVDVEASFSAGVNRDISITAAGTQAQLQLQATIESQDAPIVGSHLLLAASAAHPALIEGYTNLKVDQPTDVEIRVTSFFLPPVNPQTDTRPKASLAATGSLKVNGPVGITLPTAAAETNPQTTPQTLTAQNLIVNFETPGLAQHLRLEGSGAIEGAGVTFDERITNLLDAEGNIAAAGATPVGTIRVQQISAALLARFAPPEQKEIIEEAVGKDESLMATVTTDLVERDLRAVIQASGHPIDANFTVIRRAAGLHVAEGRVALIISPRLAALAQKDAARPITLQSQTSALIELEPFEMPAAATGSNAYTLPSQPIYARLRIEEAVLDQLPSIAEPLGVRGLDARIAAELGDSPSYAAAGAATLRRAAADRNIANMRYDVKVVSEDKGLAPSGQIVLSELSVRHLERALGQPRGTISQWTGDQGSVTADLSGKPGDYHATIKTKLPNLASEFVAVLDGRMISLLARTSTLTLSRQTLQRRLNPPGARTESAGGDDVGDDDRAIVSAEDSAGDGRATPEYGGEPAASSRIIVQADVPMTFTIEALRFPLATLQQETFDPAQVDVKIRLNGGPLKLASGDGVQTTLADLKLAIDSDNLAEGVAFTLTGEAGVTPGGSQEEIQAGLLDVNGKVTKLVGEDSILHTDQASLQMTASARGVPTAVADALANMQGLLVAAVGPQMNATFVAEDFSASTGQLDARIDTTNGWLEGLVRGKEESLRSSKAKPIKAELQITQPLRDRLLEKIHPIFADVRTIEQPLRIGIPYAVLPTDGDISKLKADIEITVGKVQIDSGSTTLKVLSFFNQEQRQSIPGEIEPISARIRNGIVNYERFRVHIDKYVLSYSGQIDLVKQTVDLRTEIPLKALAHTFQELENYGDKIAVPLVTRGKFGDLKTEIDPDFDIGKAALEAGFQGTLEDVLKGEGGLLDDLLKDLNKDKE